MKDHKKENTVEAFKQMGKILKMLKQYDIKHHSIENIK